MRLASLTSWWVSKIRVFTITMQHLAVNLFMFHLLNNNNSSQVDFTIIKGISWCNLDIISKIKVNITRRTSIQKLPNPTVVRKKKIVRIEGSTKIKLRNKCHREIKITLPDLHSAMKTEVIIKELVRSLHNRVEVLLMIKIAALLLQT